MEVVSCTSLCHPRQLEASRDELLEHGAHDSVRTTWPHLSSCAIVFRWSMPSLSLRSGKGGSVPCLAYHDPIHAHLLLTRNHPCPVNLSRCPFLDVPRTTPTEPLGGVGLGRGWGCPRFIISTSTSRPRRPRPHPPGGYPSAAALGPEGGVLLHAPRQAAALRVAALHRRPRRHRSHGVCARGLRRALRRQRRPDQGLRHLLQPRRRSPAAASLRIPTHRRVRRGQAGRQGCTGRGSGKRHRQRPAGRPPRTPCARSRAGTAAASTSATCPSCRSTSPWAPSSTPRQGWAPT